MASQVQAPSLCRSVPVTRRAALASFTGMVLTPLAPTVAVSADDGLAADAIHALTKGAAVNHGRVLIVMPELAENGNTVAVTVTVESPMTAADHIRAIHIVADKNPIARIASFHLGPKTGRAKVATNIRLATTQVVTAVVEMSDGSFWSGTQEVVVTLAACLDAG